MSAGTVARPILTPDALLVQLRSELAEVLTPGQYDELRASQLQIAVTDCMERAHRYRRLRRAAVRAANPAQAWWY